MLEIYQWGDLMEAVEYLWVPPLQCKVKINIEMQNKINKNACPKMFHACIERNGL